VFNSPDPGTHAYLGEGLVGWTTPQEQNAIERGYHAAIAARYLGAGEGLAAFYERLGRYRDAAQLYASMAANQPDPAACAAYLESAGEIYVRAGEPNLGEKAFLAAAAASPADSGPYEKLATLIYGPAGKLDAAERLIGQGVTNGADPVALYSSLGTAEQAAGKESLAEKAWLKALEYRPSFDMTRRVGAFYLASRKPDQAIQMLRRATEMNPNSAETYYMLGQAQEGAYQYSDADKSYSRAAALSQAQFGPAYADFRHRMSAAGGNT
jgi:tetratricopeptide (TPR) repeat protein